MDTLLTPIVRDLHGGREYLVRARVFGTFERNITVSVSFTQGTNLPGFYFVQYTDIANKFSFPTMKNIAPLPST